MNRLERVLAEINPSIAHYLLVTATTFLATVLATPVMRRLALRRSILDAPDGARKVQEMAIPYLGGLAIVGSASLTLIVAAWFWDSSGGGLLKLLGVLIPAWFLAVVGLIDDISGLTPAPRFIAQSIAGAITAVLLTNSGTSTSLSHFLPVDVVLTVLWVVGVTNALNLLDNMDGAASGTAAIAGFGLAAIAGVNGQFLVAALALGLAGASLGFLVWNRQPARIYMGDSGSLFLGFILAASSIRLELKDVSQINAIAVVLVLLAVPILDTSLVVVSRLQRGLSPFVGGLDHLSHRLCQLGFSTRGAVYLIWVMAAVTSVTAYAISRLPDIVASSLAVGTAVVFFVTLMAALKVLPMGNMR